MTESPSKKEIDLLDGLEVGRHVNLRDPVGGLMEG